MSDAHHPHVEGADLSALGRVVAEARRGLGVSQTELARLALISPSYVRSIEQATSFKSKKPSKPSVSTLSSLSDTLGLELADLMRLAGYGQTEIISAASSSVDSSELSYDASLNRISESLRDLSKRGSFLQARARERLEEFATDFEAIASATLRCTPEKEPHLTRLAISECRENLRAVCYQDEQWWLRDGDVYLRLHEKLRQASVRVSRIFICDTRTISNPLRQVLKRHVELGIEALVLDRAQVSDAYWRNYVLYDAVLLRTAFVTGERADRKSAEFTDDPRRIRQALRDFENLHQLAITSLATAENVLAT